MKDYIIFGIPIISGLIGWLTNLIAVKMIFRPLKPINVLGLKIQGLLPKRHYDLAEKIGEVVETHLISVEDIKATIEDPVLHKKLIEKLHQKVNIFLTEKLKNIIPFIANFLSQDVLDKINEILSEEIGEILPELIEEFVEHFEEKINLKELVKEKIKGFDLLKLENIILSISSRELKAIEIFGGILGFLIGIVQLLIITNL
jgi:uncharacterized membrane protein YheB (UPF0754 family)